jgi:hypothetical protein
MHQVVLVSALVCVALWGCATKPSTNSVQRAEHRVSVTSTAPSMQGQAVQLYVREIVPADAPRAPVVLFVHGAGTPAEVSFDSRMDVDADSILSHRADSILSQGWKPTLRGSAVDKCRSLPVSLTSSMGV